MPSNKKPRKQKTARSAGIPLTIRNCPESETALQLVPHTELMKMREGLGDEGSWHTITARLNIGVTAAYENEYPQESFRKALDAVVNVKERYKKTGRWGLSGQDYRDIGQGLVDTDTLQLSLTRKQFAKAIEYVFKNATVKEISY
jgi:outer membrane scaffolding protein for murein synthesis (MipA/OmpV family)